MLRVKNLKVYFKHDSEVVKAVDGIDFAVGENEIVGLIGESGSGKTITALSIMKLLPKENCSITGEITCNARPAIVFQEPFTSLNPVLRVGEQIEEAVLMNRLDFVIPAKAGIHSHTLDPRFRGDDKKLNGKSQTLRLLKKVKIHDPQRIYNSYPHLLSGGERQRAMIAMAIALNPKLLIADEPTTSLDVTIQAEILELILGLKRDLNMPVLFITHDFGIINKVADRVLVMKDGRIVERGQKHKILSSPEQSYTKQLLDAACLGTKTVPDRVGGCPTTPLSFPQMHSFVIPAQAGIHSHTLDPRPSLRSGQAFRGDDRDGDGNDTKRHPKSVITVKDLNKSFLIEKGIFGKEKEKIKALRNINLEVKEGSTLGLVGESGSGKTTLGKLVIGLLKADSGEIRMETVPTQIVFQDPYSSLDPRMKMRDIVLEGPAIQGVGMHKKERILRDVLFKVHLNYKDRLKYPHQFSGGQRQRIAIARALAVNPRILILDEPVSSLDVIIQRKILNLLKELQKELFLTYIFISHDLRVVEYMADDVAVMHKGEIVELGYRDQIYQVPKHPYTKRLLSSILQL